MIARSMTMMKKTRLCWHSGNSKLCFDDRLDSSGLLDVDDEAACLRLMEAAGRDRT